MTYSLLPSLYVCYSKSDCRLSVTSTKEREREREREKQKKVLQRMNRDREKKEQEREKRRSKRERKRRQGNDQKESSCGRHLFYSALTYNLQEFIFLAFP